MRPSKYDKHVCVACLIIFLYSFFIIGSTPVYESDKEQLIKPWDRKVFLGDDGYDELVAVEYPTSVIIAPLVCLLFFGLWLFEKELRPVDRRYMKKKVKDELVRIKKHIKRHL
jgi:hypothetical protein